jgi:hypothetical protein
MATQAEEQQAKEFLKRAEIRTMKKDLQALREVDALKERDKIATIKTIEEQQAEQEKNLRIKEAALAATQKIEMATVLQKNEGQEKLAEKDLKNYATEQERQQIFLMESQRFGFEEQANKIDKEKDPALKLEKNKLLLQKRDIQTKLNVILDQEKKLEGEQGFVSQKSQTTTITTERKGLEQRRGELEKEIQEVEKKRWVVEKQIEEIDTRVAVIDKSSEQLVLEKNQLRSKVLGIDKSIRDIYSNVITRVEEKRTTEAELKRTAATEVAKIRTAEKEKVQRQQWAPTASTRQQKTEGYLSNVPTAVKEKIVKSGETEEEQRTKFLRDVESWSEVKGKNEPQVGQKIPVAPTAPPVPAPPVPRRK